MISKQGDVQADFALARAYLALGETDLAFECVERTYAERARTLFWLNVNPLFDTFRPDVRFATLLEKLNLAS